MSCIFKQLIVMSEKDFIIKYVGKPYISLCCRKLSKNKKGEYTNLYIQAKPMERKEESLSNKGDRLFYDLGCAYGGRMCYNAFIWVKRIVIHI